MASSEQSRVVYVLLLIGVVVVQLADEVEAQRIANRTKDNDDLLGGAKAAALADRPLEPQRWKRTAKVDRPFPYLVSIDQEKRARSSFRGDLGKRMFAFTDNLSPEEDLLHSRVSWLPGKRFKMSSKFRGDLGKRARSSFRGDLGKRQELRAQEQDQEQEQEEELREMPKNILINDNIHRVSPFLMSDRTYDLRFGDRDSSSSSSSTNSDETEQGDDNGGDITFGGMAETPERRWNHPAPRWRAL